MESLFEIVGQACKLNTSNRFIENINIIYRNSIIYVEISKYIFKIINYMRNLKILKKNNSKNMK